MRLRRFINEGRSKSISLEQAMETIRENCKDFLKKGSILYRGVDDSNDAALIISPANFERKSRNTTNHYTLLMDNLPAWKSYPKRSKSIICATDIEYASNMGYAYRVYMFDGSKIGVCPTNDLWGSFTLDTESLEFFNDSIGIMIDKFDTGAKESDIVTYNDLLQLFNKFDDYKSDFEIDRHMFPSYFSFTLFEPYFNTDVKFIDFVKEILDPERHKFKLQNTRTFRNIKEREVWTDGTSILLRADITSDVINSF